jgi:hypothetical protein
MTGMWRLAVYAAPVGPGTAATCLVEVPGADARLWWEAAPAAAGKPRGVTVTLIGEWDAPA